MRLLVAASILTIVSACKTTIPDPLRAVASPQQKSFCHGAAATAPAPVELLPEKSQVRLIAIGDTGESDTRVLEVLATQIAPLKPDAILLLGDNFYERGIESPDGDWRRTAPLFKMGAPIFPVMGNHDHRASNKLAQVRKSGTAGFEQWRFPALNYTVRSGNLIDVVMMDSMSIAKRYAPSPAVPGHREVACITERSLQASTARWKLVAAHHPAFTSGLHQRDLELEHVRGLAPLFDQSGVAIYVTGHDHDLEFFPPPAPSRTAYLISGSGSRSRRIRNIVRGSAFQRGSTGSCSGKPEAKGCAYGFAVLDITSSEIRVSFREANSDAELYSYTIRR
ncbi:MAG TPA: metallophosphoesterase [Thermoanaerobaculia bacterium]|nr:metallophosphoesterase [Thermoanaerobaculia bacterium]